MIKYEKKLYCSETHWHFKISHSFSCQQSKHSTCMPFNSHLILWSTDKWSIICWQSNESIEFIMKKTNRIPQHYLHIQLIFNLIYYSSLLIITGHCRGVAWDEVWRSLPTQTIKWFYDSNKTDSISPCPYSYILILSFPFL